MLVQGSSFSLVCFSLPVRACHLGSCLDPPPRLCGFQEAIGQFQLWQGLSAARFAVCFKHKSTTIQGETNAKISRGNGVANRKPEPKRSLQIIFFSSHRSFCTSRSASQNIFVYQRIFSDRNGRAVSASAE